MLRARGVLARPCGRGSSVGSWQPLIAGGLAQQRRGARLVSHAHKITPGQKLRGHGGGGWKEAGWDYKSPRELGPQLRELLLHYGQMAEATYDVLGMEPCRPTWGYATSAPTALIDYLTRDYPLKPGAVVDAATPQGTRDLYEIPTSAHLSPLIYAVAGGKPSQTGLDAGSDPPAPHTGNPPAAAAATTTPVGGKERKVGDVTKSRWLLEEAIDRFFGLVSGVPIELVGGSRTLFPQNETTGRGTVPRPAFMGFVAVTKTGTKTGHNGVNNSGEPSAAHEPGPEVDVAFVWRGTIFKEEWASNFAQDKLVPLHKDDGTLTNIRTNNDTAAPWVVGVHEGFQDLYLRPAQQPNPATSAAGTVPALPDGTPHAPREVVRAWLRELMCSHNVTTITTTGHSLGGGLATLCAYDVASELDSLWADNSPKAVAEREKWETKARPAVTAVLFASPRVGNWTFVRKLSRKLEVQVLRVCNVPDIVPKVPGGWVQLLTSAFYRIGLNVYANMDSLPARIFGGLYFAISALSAALLHWPSRWGYFHAGTILEVNSETDLGDGATTPGFGQRHNMEVYLHLLSKKGVPGGATDRNPLLLNKGDDILTDKHIPADWWRFPEQRGFELNEEGRWEYTRRR